MTRMSESRVTDDEVRAALAARRELGEEMEPAVVEAFVARIEQQLVERHDADERALKRRRDHQKAVVLGAIGASMPLFAIAAVFTGLSGVIAVCAMIAVIAIVSARP